MLSIRLLALCAGTLFAGFATAAPVTLYDGSALPTSEGWTRASGAAGTVVVGAGTTQFSTVDDAGGRTSQFDTYAYATGATDFITSIRLQVNSSSYNNLDAGLTLSAFGTTGTFLQNDRFNNLMIDKGMVLWGDQGASAVVANANGFHDYAIRYLNGTLSIYFDASMNDILAGTATAILTRTTTPHSGSNVGTIVFGDATNDPGFNSNYIVDYVDFQNLAATSPAGVPEPGMVAMIGLGLVAACLARRRATRGTASRSTGHPARFQG